MSLLHLVIHSAQLCPDSLAIKDSWGSVTYAKLDALANRFARAFNQHGVQPGDRIGIWLEKSAYAIAAMQGVLRLNAVYVPLDPLSPVSRIQTIIRDCDMRLLVTTSRRATSLLGSAPDLQQVACLCIDGSASILDKTDPVDLFNEPLQIAEPADHDISYILYTSGSTGIPKGVCISNRNALSFVIWATETLQARTSDLFANHAPFHFDLSVLDLYVAFSVGATVVLISENFAYLPGQLVKFLLKEGLTIWYSVPSVLMLMIEQGKLLDVVSLPLRAILFAGEPFPIKYLRRLYDHWPAVRFLNLYGPTETNVCTFYEVCTLPKDWTKSVPIGQACSGDAVWALKEDGMLAQTGEEGELMVAGPTVMVGYWGQARHGDKPYATGDLVRLLEDGNYLYLGRRDHMVKVRGYRVESGDIEAALVEHHAILEAAVVVYGMGINARLVAFVVCQNYPAPSLLEIKRHCAERLPRYMIVDEVYIIPVLPRTRNGKVDRQALFAYSESVAREKGEV